MTILLDTIPLPAMMKVSRAWSPVEANRFYSGDGTLIVQHQARSGGQPIILSGERIGGDSVMGYAPYSLYSTLAELLTAGRTMMLALHGETLTVTWDYQQIPLEYDPILYRRPPHADDPVLLTLRLLTLPT